jgi:universal stress protein E
MLAENDQAKLTVVDIVERLPAGIETAETGSAPADLQNAVVTASGEALEALVAPYRTRVAIETKVLTGTPYLEIVREVLRSGCDLVIKIPEPQNWLDRMLGFADMNLLRHCPCPVLIVKPAPLHPYRRVLAAVDIDDSYPPEELEARFALNLQIVELAGSVALSDSAELHIVHAWHAIGESTMRGAFTHTPEDEILAYVERIRRQQAGKLDWFMCEAAADLGQEMMDRLKPRTHLVKGSARKKIPALARRIQADLLVMGSVARTGVAGFIVGNTAEIILHQIDCAVLTIKPPGFVTPVTVD